MIPFWIIFSQYKTAVSASGFKCNKYKREREREREREKEREKTKDTPI